MCRRGHGELTGDRKPEPRDRALAGVWFTNHDGPAPERFRTKLFLVYSNFGVQKLRPGPITLRIWRQPAAFIYAVPLRAATVHARR